MRKSSGGPAPYGMRLGKSLIVAGSVASWSGICGMLRAGRGAVQPAPGAADCRIACRARQRVH
eukprot:8971200-Lingulodinium_polyedra.AAC.1